jgi:magnesium-transporting ATPase (P-type)
VQSCVQYARDHARLGVRLVSGDHIETAKMVAIKAGILKPEETGKPFAVMLASEFRSHVGGIKQVYNQNNQLVLEVNNIDSFREIVHDLRVLARADATDKLTLIVGLQQLNRKIAATGDGINDLDAIARADVGIAMGSGVAAAKEASALVLTGDDFEASLRAVMWGRNIYHNITRFLQFQVTVNISCLVVLFIGILLFSQPPLTPVQLLWINLIMDIFGALALATEPPLKSVIEGSPYTDNVALLSPTVWRQILGIALYNVVIIVLVIFFGRIAAGLPAYDRSVSTLVSMPEGFLSRTADNYTAEDLLYVMSQSKARHFTYIFNIFVFLQLFNMINCRKIGKRDFNVFESFFHNWYFILFFSIIGGVQFAGTQYFPFIFRTVPLDRGEWGSCIVVGSTVLLWSAILKLLPEKWFAKLNTSRLINEDE